MFRFRPKINDPRFIYISTGRKFPKNSILGLTRVRNEALIIEDSLNHFSKHMDGLILLDDDSDDNTVALALKHPLVMGVILNTSWSSARAEEETIHRELLRNTGRSMGPAWFFYADADERFEGDIKKYIKYKVEKNIDAIRISLFDSYLTADDNTPYQKGDQLYNFRKCYGSECRNILMIWRNKDSYRFTGLDAREPSSIPSDLTETKFFCQHYGKAISIDQWEATCDYYAKNFPMYSEKWDKRRGKAIHEKSDFDTPLRSWGEVKQNPKIIHP